MAAEAAASDNGELAAFSSERKEFANSSQKFIDKPQRLYYNITVAFFGV